MHVLTKGVVPFIGRSIPIMCFAVLLFSLLPVPCVASEMPVVVDTESKVESEKSSKVYERLKERLEQGFDSGLEQIENTDVIEITGNLPERILRGIANVFAKNLRSIKAGSLMIGVISFLLGAVLALLIKKDKKIRKRAIGVGMIAIPAILLIAVFGISAYVSIFK